MLSVCGGLEIFGILHEDVGPTGSFPRDGKESSCHHDKLRRVDRPVGIDFGHGHRPDVESVRGREVDVVRIRPHLYRHLLERVRNCDRHILCDEEIEVFICTFVQDEDFAGIFDVEFAGCDHFTHAVGIIKVNFPVLVVIVHVTAVVFLGRRTFFLRRRGCVYALAEVVAGFAAGTSSARAAALVTATLLVGTSRRAREKALAVTAADSTDDAVSARAAASVTAALLVGAIRSTG